TPADPVPPATSYSGFAFDANRKAGVRFGGYGTSGYRDDTWEWDGTGWTRRSPATVPAARSGHSLVQDTARGVALLFGGESCTSTCPLEFTETWTWNGIDWTKLSPVDSPVGRGGAGFAFDGARGRAVL